MKKRISLQTSCFNTSEFLLLGRVRVCGMGQGGCVGQTFKVRTDALHSKGLSLTSLASNRIISHIREAVCLQGRGGVVIWIVLSSVQMEEMPLSLSLWPLRLFPTLRHVNPQLHVMPSNSSPQDEKEPEDEYFLQFPLFQKGVIFKYLPCIPNTNSLVCLSSLDKREMLSRAC